MPKEASDFSTVYGSVLTNTRGMLLTMCSCEPFKALHLSKEMLAGVPHYIQ